MQQIVFTNVNGQSIFLGSSVPYVLQKISGTGAAETDVQMQKAPFQDGQTYIGTLLEPRVIIIEAAILASTQEELYQRRREISQIFNPKLGPGTLRYEYDGGVREIQAVPDLAPVFPSGSENRLQRFQRTLITLICPSPFWLDEYEESKELVAWTEGLSFPMVYPLKFGLKSEYILINNEGDAVTPVIIEFNGPALNPIVKNETTGELIRVKREIPAGDRLVITTEFGKKTVRLVKSDGTEGNAMHWLDLDSTFWQLQLGENKILYDAAAGTDEAVVYIRYRNRYVGV